MHEDWSLVGLHGISDEGAVCSVVAGPLFVSAYTFSAGVVCLTGGYRLRISRDKLTIRAAIVAAVTGDTPPNKNAAAAYVIILNL